MAVIIAAHNRRQWVGDAVRSALAQRPHRPAEVIVVDDGSTDDTAAVAADAGARVLIHPNNLGAAAARNTGAKATAQPWIAPLDSDDRWLPHMLSTLWPLRANYGFVAGASMSVAGDRTIAYGGSLAPEPIVLSSPAPLVFPENFIAASGVIINRHTFWQAGGYRSAGRSAEDLDLWLRMLLITPGVCVPTVVTLYRVHPNQKSRGGVSARQAVLEIIEQHRDSAWCTPEILEARRSMVAWDEMREALGHREILHVLSQLRWMSARRRRRQAIQVVLTRRRRGRLRSGDERARQGLDGGPGGKPAVAS